MKRGIELLTHHLHPGHPLLLQDFDELLVETLIAAMKSLSLFALRIELLTGALEVVDNREDLAQGRADQLLTQIILIPALTLAEIIEISGDPHVLTLQSVVFGTQGLQLLLQLLQALGRIHIRCGRTRLNRRFLDFGGRDRLDRLGVLVLRWGGGVAAHADRSGIAA